MIVLQVEPNVYSYDGWKKAFDSDPIHRRKSGVKRYVIYQVDDQKYVIIDLYFHSLEQALAAMKALQELWTKVQGTVMVNPKARILKMNETVEL